jgi:hypothetical protein
MGMLRTEDAERLQVGPGRQPGCQLPLPGSTLQSCGLQASLRRPAARQWPAAAGPQIMTRQPPFQLGATQHPQGFPEAWTEAAWPVVEAGVQAHRRSTALKESDVESRERSRFALLGNAVTVQVTAAQCSGCAWPLQPRANQGASAPRPAPPSPRPCRFPAPAAAGGAVAGRAPGGPLPLQVPWLHRQRHPNGRRVWRRAGAGGRRAGGGLRGQCQGRAADAARRLAQEARERAAGRRWAAGCWLLAVGGGLLLPCGKEGRERAGSWG